ncbi:HAD family hydrolase [Candidatus Pelagibacter sp. Uisw_136]|uniref:HAD family hydrolase n=1 Tax=Candidatus Pelagibacter sp. Uisw_136 TaxID=3230991 RepID=UPI0039E86A9D
MNNKQRLIKAFLFDLDGTLIDSDKDIQKIINYIRINFLNKKKININKIANYVSKGGDTLIKKTLSENKPKFYLNMFRKIYLEQKINKNLILPGVINFLKFLKTNNIKIYICTNKPRDLTSKFIKNTRLNEFVDEYFCPDEHKVKKPNNKFFLKILKKIKINKEQIIYIGDSMIDLKFCENSFLEFFLFRNKRIKYPKKIYLKLLKLNKVLFDYRNMYKLKKII